VTVYLLDENVLKELSPTGNANVRAWFASVAPADIHISVMTMFEKRRGAVSPTATRLRSDAATPNPRGVIP
jgi:predicted nucleic acid-binding protein